MQHIRVHVVHRHLSAANVHTPLCGPFTHVVTILLLLGFCTSVHASFAYHQWHGIHIRKKALLSASLPMSETLPRPIEMSSKHIVVIDDDRKLDISDHSPYSTHFPALTISYTPMAVYD